MRTHKQLTELFERSPINHHLGWTLIDAKDGAAELSWEPQIEHTQEVGAIHGGLVAALADTACVYAVVPALEDGRTLTSIEFKLNFLRPVTLEGGSVRACARVARRGRRVAVVQATVVQADNEVALGLFTYMLLDKD